MLKPAPLIAAILLACPFSTVADDATVSFTRDIRPILSNNCFHCHGPDENTREADLRLDTRAGLLGDGQTGVVVAGDPEASELLRRMLSHDEDELMPPPESGKQLDAAQKRLVRLWIEQGAPWEQHWSFRQPILPAVPTHKNDWCRNEIDRFIFRKLQQAQVTPAPPAAPAVQLRRLFLDLTGVPPTIEQTDHWLARIWPNGGEHTIGNDAQWGALVDELMSSPRYGERWARRWLDLARYADTNGYEKDRDRSMWPYRDWVVDAINADMPFDRFTIEQLAGDMLPSATQQQRIATGFHRNTMLNEEGGIDPLEFRYHAMTDRVATTGTTWLGLTLGCCQCHTHKYDPISHTEYFQVFAYLNNADEPYIELQDQQREQTFRRNHQKAERLLAELRNRARPSQFASVTAPVTQLTADAEQTIQISPDDKLITVTGDNPATATYRLLLQPDSSFQAVRLTVSTPQDGSGPGRTPHGNFVLSELRLRLLHQDGSSENLAVRSATATAEQPGHTVDRAFDDDRSTGWAVHTARGVAKEATATFLLAPEQPAIQPGDRVEVALIQATGGQHTLAQFRVQLGQLKTAAPAVQDARFQAWLESERPHAVAWQTMQPLRATSNLPLLTIEDDAAIFASGDTAKRDDYRITLQAQSTPIHAIRLEALPDERLPARGPGTTYYEGTPGDFYLTEIRFRSGDTTFPAVSASHSFAKNRFGKNPATASLAIDGDIQTGWSVHGRQGERHVAVFVLKEPIPAGHEVTIDMAFGRHFASSLGRFRFAATSATTQPQARDWSSQVAAVLALPASNWTTTQRRQVHDTWLLSQPEFRTEAEQIRKLRQRPPAVTSLVMQERPDSHPRPTYRHHRGEYLQPKERVTAGLPAILAAGAGPSSRLEFARWLVSDANPLTARVVANRQWAAFFGTGLVKTLDDFGLQGETPSHPQLLDWLAVKLRTTDQWSLRKLHKRIVTSATYRQAATKNPAAARTDPDNRLLSYSPRFVLEAEIIRDQLLAAAGVLSDKRGGPPVRPPQPAGVTEAAYGRPKWNASSGDDRYRRSLYTFSKRTAPFAMFATFDAPSGEACIARRNRSNSPLQALTLLNDVMLMDIAQQSGQRLATTNADDVTRVTQLFRRTLVRTPTAEERELCQQYLDQQRVEFSKNPAAARQFAGLTAAQDGPGQDVVETAAWTALSRSVFGLDETLTRE